MLTLKKNADFQKVFKSGKWYGAHFVMIYITKNEQECNKVGFAVSKKIAKSVKRNRIRRVMRESYRLLENQVLQGNNIVVVWKGGTNLELVNLSNIKADLEKCLKKADIYKE